MSDALTGQLMSEADANADADGQAAVAESLRHQQLALQQRESIWWV